MWIGLSKVANSADFTWVDGTEPIYTHFQFNNEGSNNFNHRKCVYMRSNNNKWRLDDCNVLKIYICETTTVMVTTPDSTTNVKLKTTIPETTPETSTANAPTTTISGTTPGPTTNAELTTTMSATTLESTTNTEPSTATTSVTTPDSTTNVILTTLVTSPEKPTTVIWLTTPNTTTNAEPITAISVTTPTMTTEGKEATISRAISLPMTDVQPTSMIANCFQNVTYKDQKTVFMRNIPIGESSNKVCSPDYVIARQVSVSRIQCVLGCKRHEACYAVNIVEVPPEDNFDGSKYFYCEWTTAKQVDTDVMMQLDTDRNIRARFQFVKVR
ncbi:mucin-5AC-like isoform X2 [Anneissia japonica]|nr:mucin-5AC-like isoform X2 [Anneissia japonica]